MKRRNTIVFGIALMLAAPFASAAPADGWEWQIAPYIWAPSFNVDLNSTSPSVAATGFSSFPDVLDKLDGAFLVHAEGQGENIGAFTDFIYLGLSENRNRTFLQTQTDLDTRLFELAGVWSPGAERWQGVELFGGLRMIDVDFTFQVVPNDPFLPRASDHIGETYNDFMLGVRYGFPVSERWSFSFRGDGSWGDTDGTWGVSALAQYRAGPGALAFGWRHLQVELADHDSRLTLALDGPEIGYSFRF